MRLVRGDRMLLRTLGMLAMAWCGGAVACSGTDDDAHHAEPAQVSNGGGSGVPDPGSAGTGVADQSGSLGAVDATSSVNLDIDAAIAASDAGGSPPRDSASFLPANGQLSFRKHTIDKPGGTLFGQTSLVDIDKDGDLDFVAGARGSTIYWFEHNGADSWVRHEIGGPARTDVGGVAFDVDGDGWIDQVSGSDWYRNPHNPRAAAFEKHESGIISGHDNVAADLDGDGMSEVIALSNDGMWWYKRASDPNLPFVQHALTGKENPPVHGGAAAGNIDGDGDIDITRVDRWLENADGKGGNWIEHRVFDFGQNGPFGVQTRARVIDLDQDGDNDVVQAEGDILNGRLAWFENVDAKGLKWTMHLVRGPGHDQDFHSLAVADFDGDGDLDIFSCGGPLSSGTRKWLIWQNMDGHGGTWTEHEIFSGVECHEAVAGDVDGDGDIDICSKPWDGGDEHVYMENLSKP
jgi:hypothetical protein